MVKMSAGFWSPTNFVELEVPSAQAFLHPQLANCEVPHAADAAAPADADCGCRVRMRADGHVEAEVAPPGLDAERFCGAFDQAVELRFCGTQRDGALRARPVLDQVGAAHGYPT